MKILVVSDSHGRTVHMLEAIALESPHLILHLGDHDRDCLDIEFHYPEIPLRAVRGNCDVASAGLDIDEFVHSEKRFLMTHGHFFGVKTSKNRIIRFAADRGADVLLFGHTHIQLNSVIGNVFVINPGSIGAKSKNYATLIIEGSAISCELKKL